MLPVVIGDRRRAGACSGLTLGLVPVTLRPVALGLLGPVYLAVAAGMNVWFAVGAAGCAASAATGGATHLPVSLAYLFSLFIAMNLEPRPLTAPAGKERPSPSRVRSPARRPLQRRDRRPDRVRHRDADAALLGARVRGERHRARLLITGYAAASSCARRSGGGSRTASAAARAAGDDRGHACALLGLALAPSLAWLLRRARWRAASRPTSASPPPTSAT
jgi:hypothetical protein